MAEQKFILLYGTLGKRGLKMKQKVLEFLREENIPFEVTEHEPVYTMEDMERIGLDQLGTISSEQSARIFLFVMRKANVTF